MIEDFIWEIDHNLIALKLLVEIIEEKIMDWNMFKSNNRESVEKLLALLNSMQLNIKQLISIQKRYRYKIKKEYELK